MVFVKNVCCYSCWCVVLLCTMYVSLSVCTVYRYMYACWFKCVHMYVCLWFMCVCACVYVDGVASSPLPRPPPLITHNTLLFASAHKAPVPAHSRPPSFTKARSNGRPSHTHTHMHLNKQTFIHPYTIKQTSTHSKRARASARTHAYTDIGTVAHTLTTWMHMYSILTYMHTHTFLEEGGSVKERVGVSKIRRRGKG